jgi:hypothetical protein
MHIDSRGRDPKTQKCKRVAGRGVHRVGGTATGHSLCEDAGLSRREQSPMRRTIVVHRLAAKRQGMGHERRYTKGWWGRRREGKGGWTGGRWIEARAAVD